MCILENCVFLNDDINNNRNNRPGQEGRHDWGVIALLDEVTKIGFIKGGI